MTGRGSRESARRARIIQPSEEPVLSIDISLSTLPTALTINKPFSVVVTAHNPGTRPVTFNPHLTPFMSERWGAFENIECVTTPGKHIKIYPSNWPNWVFEHEDLDRAGFITIPAAGSVSVEHQISAEAIKAANPISGERYRLSLTYNRIGCIWWMYGISNKGLRLRSWRKLPEFAPKYGYGDATEQIMAAERRELYGDGPWTMGENPGDLCFVCRASIEFEVL